MPANDPEVATGSTVKAELVCAAAWLGTLILALLLIGWAAADKPSVGSDAPGATTTPSGGGR